MSNSFNINPWDSGIGSFADSLNFEYGSSDFLSSDFEESQKLFDRDPEGYLSKSLNSHNVQTFHCGRFFLGNNGNLFTKSLSIAPDNKNTWEHTDKTFFCLNKKSILKLAKIPDRGGKFESILQRASCEELKCLWSLISEDFYSLSTHKYGCRFIQTLLKSDKYFPTEHLEKLDQEKIFELILCPHGNHVMQLIISYLDLMDLLFIYDILLARPDLLFKASRNQCGSRVIELAVKKVLRFCQGKSCHNELVKLRAIELSKKFLDLFKPYSKQLMCDNYGNFIVSYFVSNISPELQEEQRFYYNMVIANIIELSFDTYGSRIVEKVLTSDNSVIALCAYTTFVNNAAKDRNLVVRFMEHGIGNYVLQKVLQVGNVFFYGNINFKIVDIMREEAHVLDKFSKSTNLLKWIC
uniref:PUM-HD domain-containing protein n=1 Tax=Strongyloides papillosus TaxID=174720 RepID=A0A0N5C1W2_STREA